MKFENKTFGNEEEECRSREGAWIEIKVIRHQKGQDPCRSREGAWIEICNNEKVNLYTISVAPVRERGLKLLGRPMASQSRNCRSREGAWIEIQISELNATNQGCRSRERAWIEIQLKNNCNTRFACRSREGAWIEISPDSSNN